MILKIGNKKVDFFTEISVSLKYDSVASSFGIRYYFNPDSADHRAVFRPGSYAPVVLEHEGQTLITGTLLGSTFESSEVPELATANGYSKTGVLEDCEIPLSAYPLQSDNINLKNITEKIIKQFGLKLIVDPAVSSKVNGSYQNTTGGDTQSVKAYLSELAAQRHIVLTHDELGNLVLTEVKANKAPIFDFQQGMPGFKFSLDFDAQKMHSDILVQKQANKKTGADAAQAEIKNPYCSVFRQRVLRQSTGNDTNTSLAVRNALSEELQGIKVKIEMDRWDLNGTIVRPNNIVSILNPHIYIYKRTKFFIESVEYSANQTGQTATLTCVLPEVYNNQTPVNIFQ